MAWLNVTGYRGDGVLTGKKCDGEKCSELGLHVEIRFTEIISQYYATQVRDWIWPGIANTVCPCRIRISCNSWTFTCNLVAADVNAASVSFFNWYHRRSSLYSVESVASIDICSVRRFHWQLFFQQGFRLHEYEYDYIHRWIYDYLCIHRSIYEWMRAYSPVH